MFFNNSFRVEQVPPMEPTTSTTDSSDANKQIDEADKGVQKTNGTSVADENLAADLDDSPLQEEEQFTIAYQGTSDYQHEYCNTQTYELEKYRKNAMIIFNHNEFDDSLGERRVGSEADEVALDKTFGRYGFERETFTDLRVVELFRTLAKFCSRDFTEYGCICAAIMTFGTDNGQLRARDKEYSEQAFIGNFSVLENPLGKPIIILIQASRIPTVAVAVESHPENNIRRNRVELDCYNLEYPLGSDMLIFHSSNIEHVAVSNLRGSSFIQSLCKQIDLRADREDFESICRAVNNEVFDEYQMPVMTTTLLKHLYLRNYAGGDQGDHWTPRHLGSQTHSKFITYEINESASASYSNTKELKFQYAPNINALTYELERFPINAMIIFNHENFLNDKSREGTKQDEENLRETFEQFRFSVATHDDLDEQKLFEKLKEFSEQNFLRYGCICVAILTHGRDHGYLRAYDKWYSERKLFACFNALVNPTLAAKPIIFLIQACRGAYMAYPVPVPQSRMKRPEIELDYSTKTTEENFLPTESDLLILHSSFIGRASARNWFIQTLCEEIRQHAATEHLEKITRRVRKIIALEKECEDGKQVPVTASTLLRKLFLKRNDEINIV